MTNPDQPSKNKNSSQTEETPHKKNSPVNALEIFFSTIDTLASKPKSLTSFVVILFTWTIAVFGASYFICRNLLLTNLEQRIDTYETVKNLNLEKLSERALDATKKLTLQLDRMEKIETLNQTIMKLKEEIKKLEKIKNSQNETITSQNETITEKDEEIKSLKLEITSLFSDIQKFDAGEDEVIKLLNAKYILSVNTIYQDDVDIILNNDHSSMDIGEYISIEKDGVSCRLFLEKVIPYQKAHFTILCDKT